MEYQLVNQSNKEHNENYNLQYFEQYKMYVESTEKISDRRQNANNFFLTLNTALISIIGLSFQSKLFDNFNWARVLLTILGIIICVIFWYLLRAYKQLNSSKFEVIHKIEQMLPLSLYDYEWKILGEGKDSKKYYPFSHIELLIPWIFGIIYILLGIIFLLTIYV